MTHRAKRAFLRTRTDLMGCTRRADTNVQGGVGSRTELTRAVSNFCLATCFECNFTRHEYHARAASTAQLHALFHTALTVYLMLGLLYAFGRSVEVLAMHKGLIRDRRGPLALHSRCPCRTLWTRARSPLPMAPRFWPRPSATHRSRL
jgi:hypothetical protein